MKVNVTLLMTITWAARSALAVGERPFAEFAVEFVTDGDLTGPVESFCTEGGNPWANGLQSAHSLAFCPTTSSGGHFRGLPGGRRGQRTISFERRRWRDAILQ